MKSLAVAFAWIAALLPVSEPQPADRTIFRTLGMVQDGKVEDDGTVWFTTWDEGARFHLAKQDVPSKDSLWQLLVLSREASRSVEVTFDGASGQFNPETGTIDFILCAVRFEEREFSSSRKCVNQPLRRDALAGSPELATAIGWSAVGDGSAVRARELLDLGLSSGKLAPGLEIIALRARAQAHGWLASNEPPATQAADRAWLAALADNRRLAALKPDDVEFRLSEARDLEALGAYEQAEKVYDSILERWPDETYRVTIRRAAIARLKDENERSLELLNGLFAKEGPDLGMKFHYHRGWTLSRLGRFDEAVADFTRGIESQADYPWAYLRRGCAYASIGRVGFAIRDFEPAIGLMMKFPNAESREIQNDLALARRAVEILKAKEIADPNASVPGLCDGFAGEKGRKPSPLLPAN